uniref:RRM domain-containing protein n=1 Tax=Syphacia muris TaxID=451379 RepID=A0A0N5AGP0_9BILA
MAAADLVNLSLDEIIARQKKFRNFSSDQRGINRSGRGTGKLRNGFRGNKIPTFGSFQNAYKGNEKLYTVQISNLGPMVTTCDLQELFAGHLYVDIAVQYDQRGNSRGTAVVLFKRFEDAMQLKRQFTGVRLDGRVMELYAVSNRAASSACRVLQQVSNYGLPRGRGPKFGNRLKSGTFGGFRIAKKTQSKSATRRPQVTAEQLDQELDEYMRTAKHTRVEAP